MYVCSSGRPNKQAFRDTFLTVTTTTVLKLIVDVFTSIMTAVPLHHGKIKLRDPSGIFPAALPSHFSFLASGPGRRRINFHHPAYEPNDDLLFTLYAWDHEEGGIHHGLAHTACAVIAANRPDGYLSQSREGTPVAVGIDDVLPVGDYFFHVPRTGKCCILSCFSS